MTDASTAVTQPQTAGIVSRGVAAIIDVLVVFVGLALIYLGWVFLRLAFSPRSFAFPAPSVVFSTVGFLVLATLYLTACWAISGCTAGAVVMGVEVVGRGDGWQRVRLPIAVLRAVACVLFPIGLAWVLLDRERRSAQDVLLGTRVVYRLV